MKTKGILLLASLLMIFALPEIKAQEKVKEKEKEIQIEEQKLKEMEEKQLQMKMKVEEMAGKYSEQAIILSKEFDNMRIMNLPPPESNYIYFAGKAKTSWDFSKIISDANFTSEFNFDVDKDAKSMSVSVSGISNSGSVDVQILAPGTKEFTTVRIDDFGNVNWKKTFRFDETNKDKIGMWKFRIIAKEASGNFRISVQAY